MDKGPRRLRAAVMSSIVRSGKTDERTLPIVLRVLAIEIPPYCHDVLGG
jgi:hypothetical protein